MTDTKKKKAMSPSTEVIKLSEDIEPSIKKLLAERPTQELRPLSLTQWAKRVIAEGRKFHHDDDEIANWIVAYGREGNWSQSQVSAVLNDNGIRRNNRSQGEDLLDTNNFSLLVTVRKLALGIAGIHETDVIQADYSPKRITDIAEDNLRVWIRKMNPSEMKDNKRWIEIVIAELRRAIEIIQSTHSYGR